MKKFVVTCFLCAIATVAQPMKHISYVQSYLEIVKKAKRFQVNRAYECFSLTECKDVREDWSKNKDSVTQEHWTALKQREMLLYGDILLKRLETLVTLDISKLTAQEKREHEREVTLAQYRVTRFLQKHLRMILIEQLDADVEKMKSKMKELGIKIPNLDV